MLTKVITIHKQKPEKELIQQAADQILAGGIVAFPTETVYGLGANAFDEKAAMHVYEAKGRPSDNPLIVHIADFEQIRDVAKHVPKSAAMLMKAFWPGPLTIIFEKNQNIPDSITGGLSTVAVRMPANQIARDFIRACGVPIAAPSANTSGRPSPTRASHVLEDLNGRVHAIIDGGEVLLGLESTIVDVCHEKPRVLRTGFISSDEISDVIGMPVEDKKNKVHQEEVPLAPGMKYTHYAPKAILYIVDRTKFQKETLEPLMDSIKKDGKKAAIVGTLEHADFYSKKTFFSLGSRQDDEEVAKNFYHVLRQLDEQQIEVAYVEDLSDLPLGNALMERLEKAAGGRHL